jgi:hypothetical protein
VLLKRKERNPALGFCFFWAKPKERQRIIIRIKSNIRYLIKLLKRVSECGTQEEKPKPKPKPKKTIPVRKKKKQEAEGGC